MKFPLKSAALLCVVLLLFVSVASAIDFTPNSTITACDSFGKTWSITPAACSPAVPLSLCLSGARDTLNLNGCANGAQAMNGSYVLLLGVFNAFTAGDAVCSATYWVGNGLSTINGNVYNDFGGFGGFTLTTGACPSAAPKTKDPSVRSH
ncbi:MAG TPA: hypothetical protein VH640_15060 [Bryobacteraceae bacterium]